MGNGLVFVFIFLCMAFVAGFALRWFLLLFSGVGGVRSRRMKPTLKAKIHFHFRVMDSRSSMEKKI